MKYLYETLAQVCRSMQADEPCHQVQTFHVGDWDDLLTNNLNTNTPESIYFNRKWEEQKQVGFMLPLLFLERVEKTGAKKLLKGDGGNVTLNIRCALVDILNNSCEGVSNNCSSRSKETVLEDTERVIQQIWQEVFHQADNAWTSDPAKPRFNIVGDFTLNQDARFKYGTLGMGGTMMEFKIMYSTCFEKGRFEATTAPTDTNLKPGCCE